MLKHYLSVCLPNYQSVAHDDLLIVGLNKVFVYLNSVPIYMVQLNSRMKGYLRITKHLKLDGNQANHLNLQPELVRFAVETESMKNKSLRISSHKTEHEDIPVECQWPTFPLSVLHSEHV